MSLTLIFKDNAAIRLWIVILKLEHPLLLGKHQKKPGYHFQEGWPSHYICRARDLSSFLRPAFFLEILSFLQAKCIRLLKISQLLRRYKKFKLEPV
jgi:hypothetical protein